ncbi:MAG TPA: transglycosylase family protein [Solirubrobacterales bacterium]|nr:transglycosylase family protein [Solirubrobacterales bacterium]
MLLVLIPAVALAATGEQRSQPRTAVADAVPAELPALSPTTVSFHRTIRVTVAHIEAAHRAELRRQRRQREALFASLPGGVSQETLDSIAACESGGDPTAVSSDGTYRGKYQFDYGTWESVGGSGDPAAAPEQEQDYRAALLYSQSGSSPWPICG